jgi:hypothetical protein
VPQQDVINALHDELRAAALQDAVTLTANDSNSVIYALENWAFFIDDPDNFDWRGSGSSTFMAMAAMMVYTELTRTGGTSGRSCAILFGERVRGSGCPSWVMAITAE